MVFRNILVHYAEVGIKGKNRARFLNQLSKNIYRALTGLPVARVHRLTGRLWVAARTGESFNEEALERLRSVCGIASFAPAKRLPLNLPAIAQAAWQMLEQRSYQSLRVSARRAFKGLFHSSLEINRYVGAFLLAQRPATVKLNGADIQVHIEILPKVALMYVDSYLGLGGLPVGVSSRALALLSGGIDSPVAAFRMQRRGIRAIFVHFHSHPFQSRASQEKALALAQHLARFQHEATLLLVPFGELQREIVSHAPPDLRIVLYRRLMLRLAAQLAQTHGAKALITGESVGQVASQTLSNLAVIDAAATLPVLRPLVGFDKQEIIREAQALGTFATSIVPDQDACQLFMPKHPETHATLLEIEAAEKRLTQLPALMEAALASAQTHRLLAPWRDLTPSAPTSAQRASEPRSTGTP